MATTTQRHELTEFIAMAREGIEWCEANGEFVSDKQRKLLASYEFQLAGLQGGEGSLIRLASTESTGAPLRLTDRPAGGKAHSNQYGACTIQNASQKQTNFIKALMDRKDLSPLDDSVVIDVARLRMQVATTTINKKAASAILDRLLALPELATSGRMGYSGSSANGAHKEDTMITAQRPASDKQYAFIVSLASDKQLDADSRVKVLAAVAAKTLSAKGASATIEKLLALPKATVTTVAVEAGVYTNGTTIYRVYLGQQSGRMLAAKAIRHDDGSAEFEYAGQADRFVTAAFRKLTLDEAAAWGKATGTCVICARRLDVPESVDRGIGPVCFAKFC